jgi:hypothetical protein
VSLAILDHRSNPAGMSGRGGTTRAGVGRKYRDCDLDDSYAEPFQASYALGPPAYNLASTDDLTIQPTVKARTGAIPRAMTSVSQIRTWSLLMNVVAQSGHYKPNATL